MGGLSSGSFCFLGPLQFKDDPPGGLSREAEHLFNSGPQGQGGGARAEMPQGRVGLLLVGGHGADRGGRWA